MPAKHTPTPWQIQGDGTLLHPVSHRPLTTTRIETTLGSLEILDETNEPEQNAAFIVRACNCHEELVQVLDSIHDLPVDDQGFRTIPPGFLDAARAVLKKARGSV